MMKKKGLRFSKSKEYVLLTISTTKFLEMSISISNDMSMITFSTLMSPIVTFSILNLKIISLEVSN